MSFLRSLDISATGLYAQKKRIDVVAQNIANAETIVTDSGDPYRAKSVVFRESKENKTFSRTLDSFSRPREGSGVQIDDIVEDQTPFKLSYDPTHPLANDDGYVKLSNVNTTDEMLKLMAAARAYEANTSVVTATKTMFAKSLEILK
jgi:flagellar basal-body rod protein FlgC